jgi:hypothetical protein
LSAELVMCAAGSMAAVALSPLPTIQFWGCIHYKLGVDLRSNTQQSLRACRCAANGWLQEGQ